jgi:pimeloyl-ACP methyl ester carboxylesterase
VRAARLALSISLLTFSLPLTHAQQVSANFLVARSASQHPAISNWDTAHGRTALDTELGDVALRGYLYEGRNPNGPTILVFNGENNLIGDNDAFYRSLAALGPTVITYDYRGIGFSAGIADVAKSREDGLELYDRVVRSIRVDHPVIVYGFSMGTAIAAYVASNRSVAALVLVAPIASATDELPIYARLLGNGYANATPSPDAINVLDEPSLVAQSQAPLLLIHSSADFLVPVTQGQKVFAASTAPSKQFVLLPATAHGATPGSPAAMRALIELLTRVAPR